MPDIEELRNQQELPTDYPRKWAPDHVERSRLRNILTTYFNLDELIELCSDLGVNYDNLRGDSKPAKALELVAYCERHGGTTQLTEEIRQRRPHAFEQNASQRGTTELTEQIRPLRPHAFGQNASQKGISKRRKLLMIRRRDFLYRLRGEYGERVDEERLKAPLLESSFASYPSALGRKGYHHIPEYEQRPPRGRTIINIYTAQGPDLVILGEWGMGKTIQLLLLGQYLVLCAEKDDDLPIPVVFDLASWTKNPPRLEDWMVDMLGKQYRIDKKIGRMWIDEGKLLPLLDGLDEVTKQKRDECVKAINLFRDKFHNPVPVVVCCGTKEYNQLKELPRLFSRIVVQPPAPEQIDAYLEQAGKHGAQLRADIQQHPELHSLARVPRLLNLMVQLEGRVSLEALLGVTSWQEQWTLVFKEYTQQGLERQQVSKRRKRQFLRYLSKMAVRMQKQGQKAFYLEDLQRSALSRPQRWFHMLLTVVIIGCLGGIVGLANLLANWLASGLTTLLIQCCVSGPELGKGNWLTDPVLLIVLIGLPFALIFSAIFGTTSLLSENNQDTSRGVRIAKVLAVGAAGGLGAAVAGWYNSHIYYDNAGAVVTLLLLGFITGCIGGCMVQPGRIEIGDDVTNEWSHSWVCLPFTLLVGAIGAGATSWLFKQVGAVGDSMMFGLTFIVMSFLLGIAPTVFGRRSKADRSPQGELIDEIQLTEVFGRRSKADRSPPQAIRDSVREAVRAGLNFFFIGLAVLAVNNFMSYGPDLRNGMFWMFVALALDVLHWSANALWFGIAIALFHGAGAAIQHYALRLILYVDGSSPLRYSRFLEMAVECKLLRSRGNAYEFPHLGLRDYLVSLHIESRTANIGSVPSSIGRGDARARRSP